MAVLGGILEYGLQRVLPLLHSSFFTGNSDDSLTDCATLRILAENIRYFDSVQKGTLKQATESIESFLELISYSSALTSKLSLDIDKWIQILKEIPEKSIKEKFPTTVAKSKVRKRKEQRLHRFHLVEEESEQKANQMQNSLPPFYPTELINCQLIDDSFTDDENFVEINMTTVWEKKIFNFYMKEYKTENVQRCSKSDVLIFALTILTGAHENLGFTAFNPKSWKCPQLTSGDNENIDFEHSENRVKAACIFAHLTARISRVQNGSWIQKLIIENVIDKMSELTEITGLYVQSAFYVEGFSVSELLNLTNPMDYLRLLDALVLCFDEEIPISLDLLNKLITKWYKLEEELEFGEKGSTRFFAERVLKVLKISKNEEKNRNLAIRLKILGQILEVGSTSGQNGNLVEQIDFLCEILKNRRLTQKDRKLLAKIVDELNFVEVDEKRLFEIITILLDSFDGPLEWFKEKIMELEDTELQANLIRILSKGNQKCKEQANAILDELLKTKPMAFRAIINAISIDPMWKLTKTIEK